MRSSMDEQGRKEYWYFVLFNTIISITLAVIDDVTGSFTPEAEVGLLGGIYMLAVLIPLIGAIVLLVFLVQVSKPDQNQYGANPKESTA